MTATERAEGNFTQGYKKEMLPASIPKENAILRRREGIDSMSDEEKLSQKILIFIRHELYMELRYLEPALSALAYRKMEGLLTFATDGVYLYYATEPLFRIFRKNAFFLDRAYLHTVLHCIFRHLWLAGRRERRLWNIACDIAVEMVIDFMDKTCTKRILSWLRIHTYDALKQEKKGISAAVIYRWLKEKPEEELCSLEKEFYTDDHRFWPLEQERDTPVCIQTMQNWDKTARQVTLEQSRRGDEKEEGEEFFRTQMQAAKNRRNYSDFLKKFTVLWEDPHLDLDEFEMGYYTYGLQLYGNLPLIEPVETREINKIREFVIVIDTSYSTSGELVKGFLKETCSILSQKNRFFETCSIWILQCDDRVQKTTHINSAGAFERLIGELQILGGGGTDFRPAFSHIELLRNQGEMKKPDGLLYFTDGKGVYPGKKPDYKTAFLFLEDYEETAVPPWAMRLKLEPEEWMHEYQTGKRRD